MPGSSLITSYLAALRQDLHVSPRLRERILREAEEHLRESAAQAELEGSTPEEAQRAAIARFGSPRLIARQFAAAYATDQACAASAGSVATVGAVPALLQGQDRRVMATLSRVNLRPTDGDPDRWDLADPGYLAAQLPTPVVFELEAFLIGPDAEKDAPVEATAWMDDPRGIPLVAPQPMEWCWMVGTLGVTWKRRLFLAVRIQFPVSGIYTIAVQLKGTALVERGFRVRVEG
ncbi:MAG TPA: permease prefix domain 1-containing protein [Chloroflexota bacterium]|nr:permease prefix domain 1-containing protein [Chloroflexota bacterium]